MTTEIKNPILSDVEVDIFSSLLHVDESSLRQVLHDHLTRTICSLLADIYEKNKLPPTIVRLKK